VSAAVGSQQRRRFLDNALGIERRGPSSDAMPDVWRCAILDAFCDRKPVTRPSHIAEAHGSAAAPPVDPHPPCPFLSGSPRSSRRTPSPSKPTITPASRASRSREPKTGHARQSPRAYSLLSVRRRRSTASALPVSEIGGCVAAFEHREHVIDREENGVADGDDVSCGARRGQAVEGGAPRKARGEGVA
jgi:hypothetical protein